jgi:hypothetical protein
MTTAVKELLDSFDALPDPEKQEAAAEILRRSLTLGPAELPESALVAAADELFLTLDREESGHAQP